jgi:hypothetical protein
MIGDGECYEFFGPGERVGTLDRSPKPADGAENQFGSNLVGQQHEAGLEER